MRGQLASASPGIEVRAGTAESIGLSDGAADAVFAGQAYHWFDPARAHPEIARVLRSGGVFAPIWNVRDESVPWIAELSRFADGYHDREGRHRDVLDRVDFGEWFGPVQQATFPHSWPMTADGIVELMTTRSYYLTATAAAQDRMREQVRELAAGLPDRFDMAYLTYAYRAIRR
jgi:SAM-dependent methyltransferase